MDEELPLVMQDDPYSPALSGVELPQITFLSDGDYRLQRKPAPQDWVIVLERVKK